jgi:hypothetical protein
MAAELAYLSHLIAINLNYSLNLQQFFASLMPIWTFDILPSDDIFEVIFGISSIDDDALTEKFDEVGYGSKLVYGNLGSLLIYQVMMWLFMIVNSLVLKYCP